MPYLIGIVALVGAISALNLLLALGIIRRLREHSELLAKGAGGRRELPVIAVGESVGDFAAVTEDGAEISAERLPDGAVVGFFSPDCAPCRAKIPAFAEFARTVPGGPEQVLAVVVDAAGDGSLFADALGDVARIVVETPDGPLSDAFQVRSYPTVLRVARRGEGLVIAANELAAELAPTAEIR